MTEELENQEDQNDQEEKHILSAHQIGRNIKAAERWQKKGYFKEENGRWEAWEENRKILLCSWPDSEQDDIEVNGPRANFNIMRPVLYFKNPEIEAVPTKPRFKLDDFGSVQRDEANRPILLDNFTPARVYSTKINYELRKLKFKKVLKQTLSDSLAPYGVGWIKWGYTDKTVSRHTNERDSNESYWCRRVDPRNVVYDWMATDADDMRFIAERFVLTRKEAKEYGFKVPKDLQTVLPEFLKDRQDSALNERNSDDLLVIWEYYDLVENVIYWCIIPEEHGDRASSVTAIMISDPSENPYPFTFSNYVPLVLDETNEDIIGLSMIDPVIDQAKAINKVTTKITKHILNYGTRTDYEDGAIDVNSLDTLQRNDHGMFLKIKQGYWGKVKTESTPPVGNDNYNMIELFKNDVRESLSITDFMQGSTGPATTKATTASIVQNAATNRIEEKRDIIHDYVVENVRRLDQMIQHFGEEEEFINVADQEFDEDFVEVLKDQYGFNPKIPFLYQNKEEIRGEYNFKFNVEDMIVRPKEIQLKQLIELIGVLGQNPDFYLEFKKKADIGSVIDRAFELSGIDIKRFSKGNKVSLPPELENKMWENGKSVPEPHKKDEHEAHIISHSKYRDEIQSQIQALTQQGQQVQMALAKLEALATQDPSRQSELLEHRQRAEVGLQNLEAQLDPLRRLFIKVETHLEKHEEFFIHENGIDQQPVNQGGVVQASNPQTAEQMNNVPNEPPAI